MTILFKFPSRTRPERFFETLDNLHQMIADKENFHVLCTLDIDDRSMNNATVQNRINSYDKTTALYGVSNSKIEAFNRDLNDIGGWDIVIAVSDDMRFTIYGFDNIIREYFQNHIPDLDGLLHVLDQDAKEFVPVLYIAGRRYYSRDLWIYNPIYVSLWCDNESMEVAKLRQRYFLLQVKMLNHLNPAYGHLPRDAQFDHQQSFWGKDEKTFNIRRANNFGLII